MKISVIISTLNREQLLLRLLENIGLQDLIPDEILIVEAGNTNWNIDLVPKIPKVNYKFINAIGTSLTEAREKGRSFAHNEILIFLDDDVILPNNYISNVLNALSKSDNTLGVGGVYEEKGFSNRKSWKTIVGRILGIYSDGKRNKILKSGWADYVREPFSEEITSADWLFGCNWAVKAEIFEDKRVKIETELAKWSFLEDIILGNRIVSVYGNCLKILPSLKVLHAPASTSGEISPETIRMRILYRFVFWKYELNFKSIQSNFLFFLGMVANFILMFNQKPSLQTIHECLKSYFYVFLYSPKSYGACKSFIFKE